MQTIWWPGMRFAPTRHKVSDEVLRRRLEKCSGQLDIYRIQQCLKDHETFPGAPDTYPEGNCIEAVCSHVPMGIMMKIRCGRRYPRRFTT